MSVLAEISDKMPAIPDMWILMGVLSIPLVLLAATHRWVAVIVLPVACAMSIALFRNVYDEAFLEGSFSELVWSEMGGDWVAHSFTSSLLPAGLVLIVAMVKWMRRRSTARPLNGPSVEPPVSVG